MSHKRYKRINRLRLLLEYLKKIVENDDECFTDHLNKTVAGSNAFSRELWFLYYGKKYPEKKLVCHECDIPLCINIFHIFVGTHKDNSEDMVKKGRQAKGTKVKGAKLTESDVLKIRKLFRSGKYSKSGLARQFNVCRLTIMRLLSGISWKHI